MCAHSDDDDDDDANTDTNDRPVSHFEPPCPSSWVKFVMSLKINASNNG